MSSIKEHWDEYEKHVVPKDAGPVQRSECKRAFYAGVAAYMFIVTELADRDAPQAEGVAALRRLEEEVSDFAKRVIEGEE